MKALFIYNPRAGKGLIKQNLFEIVSAADEAGYYLTLAPTRKRDDVSRILDVFNIDDYDRIICAGGDGTLCEVVNALELRGVSMPVGYIPAGSTNDFATSLGISRDLPVAAKGALTGTQKNCDMGLFNGKTFVYVAAFGMFTDVAYSTDQGLKNALGHLAYMIKGMSELASIKKYSMSIEYIDENSEEKQIDGEFILGLISSSTSIGGVVDLAPLDVSMDDGLFEVVLVRDIVDAISDTIGGGMSLTLVEDVIKNHIITFKASSLKLRNKDRASWTLDGEYGGDDEVISIINNREKLSLYCDIIS